MAIEKSVVAQRVPLHTPRALDQIVAEARAI
jgi:hypothetical protein